MWVACSDGTARSRRMYNTRRRATRACSHTHTRRPLTSAGPVPRLGPLLVLGAHRAERRDTLGLLTRPKVPNRAGLARHRWLRTGLGLLSGSVATGADLRRRAARRQRSTPPWSCARWSLRPPGFAGHQPAPRPSRRHGADPTAGGARSRHAFQPCRGAAGSRPARRIGANEGVGTAGGSAQDGVFRTVRGCGGSRGWSCERN